MAAPLDPVTRVTINADRQLIFFEDGFSGSGPLCYNYATGQWSQVPAYDGISTFSISNNSGIIGLLRFSSGSVDLQTQTSSGAIQSATLTTAATDINRGGRVVVNGVRPRINGGTPTVRIGVQDKISDSVSWSTSVSINSRTQYGNVRSEGRYVRAEVTVPDDFTTAIGADVDFTPQGKV